MKTRQIFLTSVVSALVGAAIYFVGKPFAAGVILPLVALSTSAVISGILNSHLEKIGQKFVRAVVGPVALFLALCFGVQNGGEYLAVSVIWAGVLFAAMEALVALRQYGMISDRLRDPGVPGGDAELVR